MTCLLSAPSVLSLWALFFVTTWLPLIDGTDPVYTPQTLSDTSGNSADNTSTITWADLPSGADFAAGSPSRVSEGMAAYYDFVHSFINTVFAKGIPDDIIEKGLDGEIGTIVDDYNSYISYFIGFGVCVGIGVLFFLIFPIIACCFCCCRLCGNCGGKKQQSRKDAENLCRKYTLVIILTISTVFVMVGTICIYVNNDNMTETLNNIPDTAADNINDVKTFVNNTVQQAEHVITNNFEFVQSSLFRDLDNIAYLVGLPLKTDIEDNTNISSALSSAYSLTNSLDDADTALTAIESNVTAMETAVTDLSTALKAVTDELDNIFTTCAGACGGTKPDYSGAASDIDTSAFPDLSSARTNMDNAKATNLTQKIEEAETELDDIPFRVERDANSSIESMKTTITNLSDDLADILTEITDINGKISGANATVDLDQYITDIRDYKEILETYDKYRWYGGVGLSTICLFVVIFAALGLTFGVLGASAKTPPEHRSCVSNCGGIMLMVAASLILIFSAWLMLLTFITFIPGAPLQKVFCEPLTDLEKLEEYLTIYNDQKVGAGNYFLADMLLNNKTIPLTVTGTLEDCKKGEGAFTAFKLDNKFDLSDKLNYSKTLDVQAEIDAINIDLSSVSIYPGGLQTQLTDVKNAVNIDFATFYSELGSSATSADLSSLADEIDQYVTDNGIPDPYKSNFEAQATELRRIEGAEYASVESIKTALNTSVANMESVVSNIPTIADDLDTSLQAADSYVQAQGTIVVRSILNTFVNRLLGIVDSYVAYTEDAVTHKMGSCEPVWNIYNSLLVYTFCYNFMDCFNGFWFSLGWVIFFFMPSVIVSVKLSKYFRRMSYPEEGLVNDEEPPAYSEHNGKHSNSIPMQEPVYRSDEMPSKAKFWMRNNKVTHRDTLDDCRTTPTAPPFHTEQTHSYLNQAPQNLYDESHDGAGGSGDIPHLPPIQPATFKSVSELPPIRGSQIEERNIDIAQETANDTDNRSEVNPPEQKHDENEKGDEVEYKDTATNIQLGNQEADEATTNTTEQSLLPPVETPTDETATDEKSTPLSSQNTDTPYTSTDNQITTRSDANPNADNHNYDTDNQAQSNVEQDQTAEHLKAGDSDNEERSKPNVEVKLGWAEHNEDTSVDEVVGGDANKSSADIVTPPDMSEEIHVDMDMRQSSSPMNADTLTPVGL